MMKRYKACAFFHDLVVSGFQRMLFFGTKTQHGFRVWASGKMPANRTLLHYFLLVWGGVWGVPLLTPQPTPSNSS